MNHLTQPAEVPNTRALKSVNTVSGSKVSATPRTTTNITGIMM